MPLIWLIFIYGPFAGLFYTWRPDLLAVWPVDFDTVWLSQWFYVFCRFVLIIFMSTLLTVTTTPLAIADATESLMQPLKKLKVPVHEIALMLSIALRFVPTLMDETTKIMNAQRSRGVDFSEGSLISRIKAVIPLLIPPICQCLDAGRRSGNCDGSARLSWRRRPKQVSGASLAFTRYASFSFLFS